MLFSFWTTSPGGIPMAAKGSPQEEWLADWTSKFHSFRVFTDTDVHPLLALWSPTLPDLFQRIRIPACRSDLARMVLLYEFGGLYVDAHVGPDSADNLAQVLERLSSREMVLFDRADLHGRKGDSHIVNHVLVSQARSGVMKTLITRAIAGLERHEAAEAASEAHIPYNIYILTGPANISGLVIDRSKETHCLKREYQDRVYLHRMDKDGTPWPFAPYRYYSYRRPGGHWSERQNVEALFEPRPIR